MISMKLRCSCVDLLLGMVCPLEISHMHIQRCKYMLACTHESKKILYTHTYEGIMTAGTEGTVHAGKEGRRASMILLSVVEWMDR